MATICQITDRVLSTYTPVPPVDDTVCDICHRLLGPQESGRCESCELAASQVTSPVTTVAPVSFSRDQYHYVLRDYKNDGHPRQLRFRRVVAATLARFYIGHEDHLRRAMGDWDTICVVPSTTPGATDVQHPMFSMASLAPRVPNPTPLLITSNTPPSHRVARDDGFRVLPAAAGRAVLLVDDTYTTGATLQSAASALANRGAQVVGALVLGRYVNPDYAEHLRSWWSKLRNRPFTFDVCCLE